MRSRLAPMHIGQYGQLQEWLDDVDDPNDHHRHISHLYGLFPSNQISPYRTPQLYSAAKNYTSATGRRVHRLEHGMESKLVGKNVGWKPCLSINSKSTYSCWYQMRKVAAVTTTCSMPIRLFRLMAILVAPRELLKCSCKVKMERSICYLHCRMFGRVKAG